MTRRAALLGTGSALPKTRVTNQELAQRIDTSDEWIVERTGVRARHIAGEGETTATLAIEASLKAIDAAGMTPGDIDLIVLANANPDQTFPDRSTQVQAAFALGDSLAFDVPVH